MALLKEVQGRKVTLARSSGRLFCFDSTCYHMGGPLSKGDIEDFNGTTCVTCPWHGHKISLETGGTLEKGLMQTVCESAPKQRLHTAIDSPDGFIHVMLNDLRSLPSDKYNSHVFSYARPSQNGFGLHHTGTGMQGFASESRAFLGMAGGHRPSSMDEDEPMNLSQTDSETSEYTSAPSPLMPYAGFNRSPVSPAQAKTSQTGQLDFVRRKAIPFGRHAEARAAIFGKAKPPPFAPMAPAPKQRNFGTSQRTLQDLWKQPIAAQEIASDDMQF